MSKHIVNTIERQIFRRGSTTFYASSLLFPVNVRSDIFDLYSFVRVADDYVDELPQDPDAFYELRDLWEHSRKSVHYETSKRSADSTNERVVKNMVRLTREHNFDPKWVDDFLDAMESDLLWSANGSVLKNNKTAKNRVMDKNTKNYKFKNRKMLMFYIHGSAEVVGLMMARIMNLSKSGDSYAQQLGRSLQSINFIRDINEDINLGRCYFVNADFEKFGLIDLSENNARANPEAFEALIHEQIDRYRRDRQEASKGFKYIPRRCRIAIKTAVDLYDWTASEIDRNPLIVYEKKVKPSRLRILKTALSNIFTV